MPTSYAAGVQSISPSVLDEVVGRIVAAAEPLRIVLFGSAARGDMHPDSDVDLMVVVPDGVDCRPLAKSLHRALRGIDLAKDILVFQDSDVRRNADNPYLVIHRALTEGREIYRASAA